MAYIKVRMVLKGQGDMLHKLALCFESFHSSKTELDQTFPAISRKEYT